MTGLVKMAGILQGTNTAVTSPVSGAKTEDSSANSLLNFMNFASGNVKTALEKPANFKRNINHRRYLQKQLRNYAKRRNEGTTRRTNSLKNNTQTSKTDIRYVQKCHPYTSNFESYQNHFNNNNNNTISKQVHIEKDQQRPLRERNLPPSFFKEPPSTKLEQVQGNSARPPALIPISSLQYENPAMTNEEFFPPNNFDMASLDNWYEYEELAGRGLCHYHGSDTAFTDNIPIAPTEAEEFLTGEELTRNIDIKDLYVPELYYSDRGVFSEPVGYETQQATDTPPHYTTLTPPCSSDPVLHSFQYDFDSPSLPSFARAFLNASSLSYY